MASLDFDATRPYKPNFTIPQNAPVFPDQPRIGVNPPGTGLAVDSRPNFTMPKGALPDEVIGHGPAPKGMNTAGAADAAVKPPPGPSLRAGLGRVIDSGSAVFDAVKGAGDAAFNAGKGANNAVFGAGKAAASIGAKAIKPALGFAGAATGFLPHASAYGDDSISTGDKFKLAGSDALRTVATGAGGLFGAGVGSGVPVAGTIAGGIVGAGVGDHYGHKLGNAVFGSDDILRKSGRNPDRDIIDAAMNKDGQGFFGGGPGGNGPTPTAGGLPVQTTAGGLPVQTTANQADQMRYRSAIYPGQPVAEQAAGGAAGAAVSAQAGAPTNTLRGQSGTDMGGGLSKFVQNGSTLYSNVTTPGDNDRLMNRRPTSAQNQSAMDGIQARQDQGDAAYVAKRQYDSEVADAQALRGGGDLASRIARQGPNHAVASMLADQQNKTALRGQDIMREGHFLTNDVAKANARYQMNKDKRDFDVGRSDHADLRGDKALERGDKTFEQNQTADKAYTSKINDMHTTTVDGKPVVDQAGANATRAGVDTMIARQVAELKSSGTPQDLVRAENLSKNGVNALAPDMREKIVRSVKLMNKVNAGSSNINPLRPDPLVSSDPRDYFDMKTHSSGDLITKTGQRIPARFLDKQDSDHWGGTPTNEFNLLRGTR